MTEYRIFQLEKGSPIVYLQFKGIDKTKETKWLFWTKEVACMVWKFIPKEDRPILFGDWLTPEECPWQITYYEQFRFIQSSVDHLSWLTDFKAKYPNIEDYFFELNTKRRERLDTLNRASEFQTQYL